MLTKIIIIGSSSEEEKETSLFISLASKSVNNSLINEESLADFLVYMKCGNRWELDRGDIVT